MKKEILSDYYAEWLLCWMIMMSDFYVEWLLCWVIKMINMLHRFMLSILIHQYLNTWKEKTILFNAYFIDAWSSTDSSQLFSKKVIRLNDILDFSFIDTWILEKKRQFYLLFSIVIEVDDAFIDLGDDRLGASIRHRPFRSLRHPPRISTRRARARYFLWRQF